MLCPGDPNGQTTNHRKCTLTPVSHQSSDLTLRLHSFQTAHFTEQGVDSSLKPTTAFILASHFHLAAPSDIISQGRAFTPFGHVRAPLLGQILPRQVVNIFQNVLCTATLSGHKRIHPRALSAKDLDYGSSSSSVQNLVVLVDPFRSPCSDASSSCHHFASSSISMM